MKILFFTSDLEDYLSDTLLHGFRSIFSEDVVDFPQKYCLYKDFKSNTHSMHGNGFSIYHLLENIDIDRTFITRKIEKNYFDLIVFSNIDVHFGLVLKYLPYLHAGNTMIIDGADSPAIYPYSGFYWRRPYYWLLPKFHTKFKYYKREWSPQTVRYRWFKLIPISLCKYLPEVKNLKKISFSISEDKIIKEPTKKEKLFGNHIVDDEIAKEITGSSVKYAFKDESAYYSDLQKSRFGITMKRSGWDCLRHYEIAANGTVPCFKNLSEKAETCAPHGLNSFNCIEYHHYKDLMEQINGLSESDYIKLQKGALNWVRKNSTTERVRSLLNDFYNKGIKY